MINTVYSNYYEVLRAVLLENLKTENGGSGPGAVFSKREVVIPSLAVADDIKRAMARQNGVFCGVDFEFIGDWLESVTHVESSNEHTRQSLLWPIWQILGDGDFTGRFPRLESFLAGKDETARYELASRVANVFRRYIAYRLDWVLEWIGAGVAQGKDRKSPRRIREKQLLEAHPDFAWQRALWEKLADPEVWSDAGRIRRLPECFETLGSAKAGVLHIFLPFVVPPVVLPFLYKLAHGDSKLTVWLYIQNPSAEFWFDGLSWNADGDEGGDGVVRYLMTNAASTRATIDRLWLYGSDAANGEGVCAGLEDSEGFERAHANTAGGVKAFDLTVPVQEFRSPDRVAEEKIYLTPTARGQSLLTCAQEAVLTASAVPLPGAVPPEDHSVRILQCPNPVREAEALCDLLQTVFAESKGKLRPEDVLIALPDFETYAPIVEGVFEAQPRESRIAWRVVGKSLVQENLAAQAVVALGDLVSAKAQAADFEGWLELPIVMRHWALTLEDLSVAAQWLHAAGYRFALSDAHARELGFPNEGEGSLASAMERLSLGFAMSTEKPVVFAGRLAVTGTDDAVFDSVREKPELLEKLLVLSEKLESARIALTGNGPVPVTSWSEVLFALLTEFFGDEKESPELMGARRTIRSIAKEMRRGLGDDACVAFPVFWHAFKAQLSAQKAPVSVKGAVTIADIAHSRGLPFAVIAVLGLGKDSGFPGRHKSEEFDLMALRDEEGRRFARRADRDSRADNRNLFFDLFLAARQHFFLSYVVGEGAAEGKKRLPSPVLEDFVEFLSLKARALDDAAQDPENRASAALKSAITARIPLTAYAAENFVTRGARFWSSHSQATLRVVCAEQERMRSEGKFTPEAPFVDKPLCQGEQLLREIPVGELGAFWHAPEKTLLKSQGIRLLAEEEVAPLDILPPDDPLSAYCVKSKIEGLMESGVSGEEVRTAFAADPANGAVGVRETAQNGVIESIAEERAWLSRAREGFSQSEETVAVGFSLPPAAGTFTLRADAVPLWKKAEDDSGAEVIIETCRSGAALERLTLVHVLCCAAGRPVGVHLLSAKGEEIDRGAIPADEAKEVLAAILALYLTQKTSADPGCVWLEKSYRGRDKAADARVELVHRGLGLDRAQAASDAVRDKFDAWYAGFAPEPEPPAGKKRGGKKKAPPQASEITALVDGWLEECR